MRAEIQVSVYSQRVTIELGTYATGLYEKWMETGDDEVFSDLADFIGDQVAGELQFDIEDVKPSG